MTEKLRLSILELDRWEEKEQSQGKTEKKEKIYLDRWDEEDEQAKALLLSKEVAGFHSIRT